MQSVASSTIYMRRVHSREDDTKKLISVNKPSIKSIVRKLSSVLQKLDNELSSINERLDAIENNQTKIFISFRFFYDKGEEMRLKQARDEINAKIKDIQLAFEKCNAMQSSHNSCVFSEDEFIKIAAILDEKK